MSKEKVVQQTDPDVKPANWPDNPNSEDAIPKPGEPGLLPPEKPFVKESNADKPKR